MTTVAALVLGGLLLAGATTAAADAAGAKRGEGARALAVLPDELAEDLRSAEGALRAVRPKEAAALAELRVWRARVRAALGDQVPGMSRRGLFKDGAYRSPLTLDGLVAMPPAELERAAKAAVAAFTRWMKQTDIAWDRAVFGELLGTVSLVVADTARARLEKEFLAEAAAAQAAWRGAPQSAEKARAWIVALVNAAHYAEAVAAFEAAVKQSCATVDAVVMDDVSLALELTGAQSERFKQCKEEITGQRTRAPAIEPHAVFNLPASVTADLVKSPALARYLELARGAFAQRPRERALYDYLLALRCVELAARGGHAGCDPEQATAAAATQPAHPWVRIRAALLRGRLLRDAGRYEESLEACRAARAVIEQERGGPAVDAEAVVEEGNALVFVNDVEGAGKKYAEVEQLLGAVRREQGEGRAVAVEAALKGNRALLAYARLRVDAARGEDLDQDAYEQARGDLETAKKHFATIADAHLRRAYLGAAGNNLTALFVLGARAFHNGGKRQAALAAAVTEVERLEKEGDGSPLHAAAVTANQCAVGRLRAIGGKDKRLFAAGRTACDAAVGKAAKAGVETYRFRALHERALVRAAAGDRTGSAADFEEALRSVEGTRRALGDPALRANFLYDKDDFFADAVKHFALEANDPKRALRFAEHARGRHFLDLVARSREGKRKGLDEAGLKRHAVLPRPEQVPLAPRTFVVSYYLGRDFALAQVVKPDHSIVTVPLATERKGIDELADRWRKQVMAVLGGLTVPKLADGSVSETQGRVPWQRTLAELYDLLFKAVDEKVLAPACKDAKDGECTVAIVAQGLLHHVPFAALVTRQDRGEWPRPRYLVDRYAVFYAPSVSALGHVVAARPGAERSLVVTYTGEDLPAVRREIDRIKKVLPQVVELDGSAPRAKLFGEMAQRGLVMIAAHGVLSPEEPLASKLVVAPDQPPVTLADIMKLKLDGETVYLSACETAQVAPFLVAGDDYLSLGRGFIAAGARRVVATLWRLIDAAGGEVSVAFFGGLYAPGGARSAAPGAQALRTAMLKAIDYKLEDGTPMGRSPIFWAPFTLTGDPR